MAVVNPKADTAAGARTGPDLPNRQSQRAYRDFRTVNPHTFLDETYTGTGGYSGKIEPGNYSYLIPNATENFYQTRNRMSVYLNLFKKFINAKFEPIFKQTIKTHVQNAAGADLNPHTYLEFAENVTGGGVNKTEFMRRAIRCALVHDVAFIVMDKQPDAYNPHLFLKSVVDVLDYKVDAYGALTEILFSDGEEKIGDNETLYKRRRISLYEWSYEVSRDGKNWRVVTQTPNTLGVLPVYPLWAHRSDDPGDYVTFSPTNYEIAACCAWLYDKGSKLDYLIDKQAHAILVMQGELNAVPNGTDNALIIGTSERPLFQPTYISPDPSLPGVHQARIDSVLQSLFDLMADGGVSASQLNSPESGVARAYKFLATNATLKQTVSLLSAADVWIYKTYKLFVGDNFDWVAFSEYPNEFSPVTPLSVEDLKGIVEFYECRSQFKAATYAQQLLFAQIDPMASSEDSRDLVAEISGAYENFDHHRDEGDDEAAEELAREMRSA